MITKGGRIAWIACALGWSFALLCLIHTTATTMTLFFMVGIPCFLLALGLYCREVLRDLQRHRVL
jgi:hypothetical protein